MKAPSLIVTINLTVCWDVCWDKIRERRQNLQELDGITIKILTSTTLNIDRDSTGNNVSGFLDRSMAGKNRLLQLQACLQKVDMGRCFEARCLHSHDSQKERLYVYLPLTMQYIVECYPIVHLPAWYSFYAKGPMQFKTSSKAIITSEFSSLMTSE